MKDRSTPGEMLARAYALEDQSQALALYRDWAADYDATMLDGLGYLTPSRTAKLLAGLVDDKATPILDVGSGTGLAGVELASLGYTLLDAVDISPEMLAVAAARSVYRNLVEADLTRSLPIADATYGAMICTGTFTHAHVGAQSLDELMRCLAPGGIFACTIHGDVMEPSGFADWLNGNDSIEMLYREPGTYYRDSKQPEGLYLAWRKR
ncbi:MAG: methyltransferase domain-containing protein [Nitratireductor sp.]|nr:methyltransferase domain-containing protein [Nitratireductor sp.]